MPPSKSATPTRGDVESLRQLAEDTETTWLTAAVALLDAAMEEIDRLRRGADVVGLHRPLRSGRPALAYSVGDHPNPSVLTNALVLLENPEGVVSSVRVKQVYPERGQGGRWVLEVGPPEDGRGGGRP
jgi:hypothetical protein